MGKSDFDILSLEVDDGVESGSCHIIIQQIDQTVTRKNPMPVIDNGQPGVQVGIIAQHRLDKFGTESIIQK